MKCLSRICKNLEIITTCQKKKKVIGNNRIKVAWLKLNDFALRQVQYNEELIPDVYNEA